MAEAMSDGNAIITIRTLINIFNMSSANQAQLFPILQPLFARLLLKFPKKNDFMSFINKYIVDIQRLEGFANNNSDTYSIFYTMSDIKPKIYKIRGILDSLNRFIMSQSHSSGSSRSSSRSNSRGGKNKTRSKK